jgi:hypothetical protein
MKTSRHNSVHVVEALNPHDQTVELRRDPRVHRVRGFFVVESVATSDIQLGADAAPVAIRVRAGLREWAPGSEFDPAAPPRLASVPLGIAPIAISYSSPAALLGTNVSAANYTAPTFNQPGVSPLVDNPLPCRAGGPTLSYADVPASAIVRSPL